MTTLSPCAMINRFPKTKQPHICTCPKTCPGFPSAYVMVFFVFNDVKWEVVVCFVDIGGIVALFLAILVVMKFSCFFAIVNIAKVRDRPFNLQGGYDFLFRSEFFFRTTRELEYLFFLSRIAQICFPEFNIRLYDKNSESDYFFFPPPKSEYFFQQHWESEYFFRKKP